MNKTSVLVFLALITALVFAACGSGPKQTATEDTTAVVATTAVADTSLPAPDEFVEVDDVAEMIYMAKPEYPRVSQQRQTEGTSWVKVLVNWEGSVIDGFIYKTSGSRLLDDSSLKAARECKFKPGRKDGHAVAMWIVFKYEFKMPH